MTKTPYERFWDFCAANNIAYVEIGGNWQRSPSANHVTSSLGHDTAWIYGRKWVEESYDEAQGYWDLATRNWITTGPSITKTQTVKKIIFKTKKDMPLAEAFEKILLGKKCESIYFRKNYPITLVP